MICDGKRVAIALIGEHELSFVIGAPKIVRIGTCRKGRPLSVIAPPPRPVNQIMSMQHSMNGADGGEGDLQILASDLLADLRGAPTRVLTLQRQDQALDRLG